MFEQLLSKEMSKYFETVFDPFKSAYRKMYICETTLGRLVEDWKHAIDHGKSVGVLSTDMSKASRGAASSEIFVPKIIGFIF